MASYLSGHAARMSVERPGGLMVGEKEMQEVALAKPGSGQTGFVQVEPAHVYVLDFDPAEADCELKGGNVQWRFDDGAVLVLENFFDAAASGPFYLQTSDGAMVLGGDLVEALAFDPNSMNLEGALFSLGATVEFLEVISPAQNGQEDTLPLPGDGLAVHGTPHGDVLVEPLSGSLFTLSGADTLQLRDLLDTSEHMAGGESTVSLASIFEDLSSQSGQHVPALHAPLTESAFYAFAPDDMDSITGDLLSLKLLFF